jgi:hypothetical protein
MFSRSSIIGSSIYDPIQNIKIHRRHTKRKKEIKVLFMNRRIYHMDMRHIANRKIKIPHHNLQLFLGFDVSCSTFNTETPPP